MNCDFIGLYTPNTPRTNWLSACTPVAAERTHKEVMYPCKLQVKVASVPATSSGTKSGMPCSSIQCPAAGLQGKEFMADNKETQIGTLKQNVANINEELIGIQTGLHAGKFVDAESDPEEVVADLEAALQHISGLGEAMQTYNSFFALFEMEQDDLSNLMLAEKEANARYRVLGLGSSCQWSCCIDHSDWLHHAICGHACWASAL